MERERVHRETRVLRVRCGGRRCGSCVAGIADAGITDAGVASRGCHKRGVCVQVRTRGERGRERGSCVALTEEEHRRGHGLRVASIQEREGRVKELPRRGSEIRVSNKTEEGR